MENNGKTTPNRVKLLVFKYIIYAIIGLVVGIATCIVYKREDNTIHITIKNLDTGEEKHYIHE